MADSPRWLRDLPVQRRVSLVMVLTCFVVLLLACVVLGAYELSDYRRAMVRDMTVMGDVVARNTRAALAFDDADAAERTMEAFEAEPAVRRAHLVTKDGTAFADYVRADAAGDRAELGASEGFAFLEDRLELARPVVLDGRRIGTLHLVADLDGMHERLGLLAGVSVLVLAGSTLVALVLSWRMRRPIAGPILALAETARDIAERKDFGARAVVHGADEVGELTAAFNEVLAGVEAREAALQGANDALRAENAERRRAEAVAHARLGRLHLLEGITRSIGQRDDLADVHAVVLANLEEKLPVDFACACTRDPGSDTLVVSRVGPLGAALAEEIGLAEGQRFAIGGSGLARCLEGHLVHERDASVLDLTFPRRLARAGLLTFVIAPLIVEGRVFGLLLVARRQPRTFSSGECEFLRQLSDHVALAARQLQLHAEVVHAYDELRRTQEAALQQERLRALGQMASGIAHDINNAISPITLYTQGILERDEGLDPATRAELDIVRRAADDVAATVARLREFCRERQPQAQLAAVALGRIAEQVVDLTRARWSDMPQQRGVVVRVRVDAPATLPDVAGVESEIREALTNLVLNALDAMPEGGTLTLRTRLASREGQPRVVLEVEDDGQGMDEEVRRRCLEPFFTTKGERGTGLGLAMVYGMAARHGADMDVESEPGRGTIFRLSFPLAARAAAAPVRAAPVAGPRARLLLVDDDDLVLGALAATLRREGHEITTATGGEAGIAAFRAALAAGRPHDAVVTDLGMPGTDGRTVASAVKAAAPGTPVVLLTGWGTGLASEDVPDDVDVVLGKPPSIVELRQALHRLLSDAGRPGEAVAD